MQERELARHVAWLTEPRQRRSLLRSSVETTSSLLGNVIYLWAGQLQK